MFKPHPGSWIKQAKAGDKISVEIQTVIGNGFVVSFTDSEGTEFRGVLLKAECSNFSSQSETASVSTPHNQLANPLSYLHDHPYSKLKNYAKKVSTKMPSEVLLQWNSVPELTINGIASRKETCSHVLETQDHEIRRATVEVDPGPHTSAHSDLLYPCYVPGADRAAKFLAHLRMKADLEELDRAKHSSSRSRSQEPRSRKRIRSPSPLRLKAGKNKAIRLQKSGLATSELGREARGGSVPARTQEVGLRPPQKVPLKVFSVDLLKFPVGTKANHHQEETSEDFDVIIID